MNHLCLFSGIGGFCLGLSRAGPIETVAFSELEKFPSAVLNHNYPDIPNWGNINAFKKWPDRSVDIITGGSPCQSFSVAGLRKGLADPRGNLALVYLAVVDRYRPRWILFENVPGLRSSDEGRALGAFLGALGQLGYGWAYRSLDAQFFGVAQRRKRVFVVGYLGDWRRAAAVLFEPESLRRDPPPRREARQDVAGTISARTSAGGGLGTDFEYGGGVTVQHAVAFGGNNTAGPIDIATACNAHGGPHGRLDFESETFAVPCAPAISASSPYGDHESREGLLVAHSLRGEGLDASEDGTGRGTPLVPVAFNARQDPGVSGVVSAPLDCNDGTNAVAVIKGAAIGREPRHGPQYGEVLVDGSVYTLNCVEQHAVAVSLRGRDGGGAAELGGDVSSALRLSQGGSDKSHVLTNYVVRRLTPRECERLQGFPDDWTKIPWRGKPADLCPDGPRYKGIGNAVAVPVIRWIGERILLVDGIE